MKNSYFSARNILILNAIAEHLPEDTELLLVPQRINAGDKVVNIIQKLRNKPNANLYLIWLNLLQYLQYTNQKLSIIIASHRYIIKNRNISFGKEMPQFEIDQRVETESIILSELLYSTKHFISNLRIIVDQLLLLIRHENNDYDSIGSFLNHIEKNTSEAAHWKNHQKFLIGLNLASNYLKHHPFQLESPHMNYLLESPALLVVVSNNKTGKKDKDYFLKNCQNILKLFQHEIYHQDGQDILFWVSCKFLIAEFNAFFEIFLAKLNAS